MPAYAYSLSCTHLQHMQAHVSIRQHSSAYGSICQHTHTRSHAPTCSIRKHTSAYVSTRQHTPAYASIGILALMHPPALLHTIHLPIQQHPRLLQPPPPPESAAPLPSPPPKRARHPPPRRLLRVGRLVPPAHERLQRQQSIALLRQYLYLSTSKASKL
jgi:hypothetical protein